MIVVANPGTHPELTHLAAGIARSGDVRYLTSSSWSRDSLLQRLAATSPVAGTGPAVALRRRALPSGLPSSAVSRVAGLHELAFQVARSRGLPVGDRLMFARNRRFQAGARARIERSRPEILVAQYTAALELFQVPGQHLRVLNHPIVHHAWMAEQERAEQSENPVWAGYLRGSSIPQQVVDRMARRMDAEIEAADAVLVPSEFVRRTFEEAGVDGAKLIVSNLGADLPSVEPADDLPPRGPLRVLYAGQVTQRKGISYLLEAVQRVPGVELVVMGHMTPGIEPQVRRYPRVQVLPSAPKDQLSAEYRRADLLALPSLAEGFPLVAIEAMAHGTAPVLTEAAAADDLIEDGVSGYRVRTRDVDDLVRVLQSAVHDRDAVARAGRAARLRAERFTWSAYEARTIGLLRERAAAAAEAAR